MLLANGIAVTNATSDPDEHPHIIGLNDNPWGEQWSGQVDRIALLLELINQTDDARESFEAVQY